MRGLLAVMTLLSVSVVHASEVRPTVAWDATGLSVSNYERLDALNLERRAVVRLVDDGFAVVGVLATPRVTIRLKDSGNDMWLEVSGDLGTRRHPIKLDGASLAEVHLEIMQRCVTLAREVLKNDPGPAPKPPAKPLTIDVGLAGGGVWRSPHIDPIVSANFAMSFTSVWGVHLRGGVTLSSGTQVSVQDWTVLLGPRVEFQLSPSWSLALSALGGTRLHATAVVLPFEGSGMRLDPAAALLVRLRRELKWGLGIEVSVGGGLSPGISHRLGATTLWERGPASLEATLGLGWRSGDTPTP